MPVNQIVCNKNGSCLIQDREGYWHSNNDCVHNCKPVPCVNCGDQYPLWLLIHGTTCLDCNMAREQSVEHYENRRTKLNCHECLKPLDRRYHRLDHKKSNKPWVVDGEHKLCWMKREIKLMGDTLDDEYDL